MEKGDVRSETRNWTREKGDRRRETGARRREKEKRDRRRETGGERRGACIPDLKAIFGRSFVLNIYLFQTLFFCLPASAKLM